MLSKDDLITGFQSLGIGGATVMVHSRPRALGDVEGGVQTIFEALEEAVKPGRIIWPTFSFALARGEPFSYRNTPSELGSLTEIARKKYLRFGHPMWSFACRGPRVFMGLQPLYTFDAFGSDSVFQRLTVLDGKIMIIGLPWNTSWTYVHYIEQCQRAPWRVQKIFRGSVNGAPQTCAAFVRRDDVKTNVEPTGESMERAGKVKTATLGDTTVKVIDAADAFNFTAEIITTGRAQGMLYEHA